MAVPFSSLYYLCSSKPQEMGFGARLLKASFQNNLDHSKEIQQQVSASFFLLCLRNEYIYGVIIKMIMMLMNPFLCMGV